MATSNLYYVDGDNENRYSTLNEVRWHIEDMSEVDKQGYNGLVVARENDESFIRIIQIKGNKVILKKHDR